MSLHCRSLPLLLLFLIRLLPFTSLFFFSLLFCFVFRCFCLFTRRAECHRNNMYVAVSDCCSRLRFFVYLFHSVVPRIFRIQARLLPPPTSTLQCVQFSFLFCFLFIHNSGCLYSAFLFVSFLSFKSRMEFDVFYGVAMWYADGMRTPAQVDNAAVAGC